MRHTKKHVLQTQILADLSGYKFCGPYVCILALILVIMNMLCEHKLLPEQVRLIFFFIRSNT